MKTATAMFMILALVAASGCWLNGRSESPRGGIAPKDEGFSITVPTSTAITQGATLAVTISLKRGAYFKQDVQLDIKPEGISVTPTNVLVKAGDKADVQLMITVAKDAAFGNYRVAVKGTPAVGESTSTAFTVKVVAP